MCVSVPISHPTAPCLPGDVVADLDCNANTFAVRWKGSDEGLEQYTAIAIGSDRSRATCNTTATNCVIPDLKCGLNYQIVMTTSSVNCGTIEGSDYSVHSGRKCCQVHLTEESFPMTSLQELIGKML